MIITEDYAVTPTAGGKIAAQIYHAGRETSSAITGEQPVGPSALKDPTMPETPREMTVEEIHELVEKFGDCARRAKEAGFENLKGHRTVGGMRASIYNAMPYEGVVALVDFMKKFEAENK